MRLRLQVGEQPGTQVARQPGVSCSPSIGLSTLASYMFFLSQTTLAGVLLISGGPFLRLQHPHTPGTRFLLLSHEGFRHTQGVCQSLEGGHVSASSVPCVPAAALMEHGRASTPNSGHSIPVAEWDLKKLTFNVELSKQVTFTNPFHWGAQTL